MSVFFATIPNTFEEITEKLYKNTLYYHDRQNNKNARNILTALLNMVGTKIRWHITNYKIRLFKTHQTTIN